jgi:ankyrin repeat protein
MSTLCEIITAKTWSFFVMRRFQTVSKIGYHSNLRLHSALLNQDLEEAKRLIDNGADVDELDAFGVTPLGVVCGIIVKDRPDLVGLLLDAGADINKEFANIE